MIRRLAGPEPAHCLRGHVSYFKIHLAEPVYLGDVSPVPGPEETIDLGPPPSRASPAAGLWIRSQHSPSRMDMCHHVSERGASALGDVIRAAWDMQKETRTRAPEERELAEPIAEPIAPSGTQISEDTSRSIGSLFMAAHVGLLQTVRAGLLAMATDGWKAAKP